MVFSSWTIYELLSPSSKPIVMLCLGNFDNPSLRILGSHILTPVWLELRSFCSPWFQLDHLNSSLLFICKSNFLFDFQYRAFPRLSAFVFKDNITHSILPIEACSRINLGLTSILDDDLGCRIFLWTITSLFCTWRRQHKIF